MSSDERDPTKVAYDNFIESFLIYQRLFQYSGTIEEILDLPYCIFNDLIIKQQEFINKEKKAAENAKENGNTKKSRNPFKKRN